MSFEIENGVLVKYHPKPNETAVRIPDGVDSIGKGAFQDCDSLVSIQIPEGVVNIGNHAFSCCSQLKNIDFPDSIVNIGEYAFFACHNLRSLYIPSSVISIGDCVVDYCKKLQSIDVSEENKKYSSLDGILYDKTQVSLLRCPEDKNSITFSPSVAHIEDGAFYGCSRIVRIKIPNSVTYIGAGAFSMCCNLLRIDIPASVTYIGRADYTFRDCKKLCGIYVDERNNHYSSVDGILYDNGQSVLFYSPVGKTSVEIPASVLTMMNYAVNGCACLQSVDIPNSVSFIGKYAFSGCSSLKKVHISENVLHIEEGAFMGCKIDNLLIPQSVISIGKNAFMSNGMKSVVIPDSVQSIAEDAFWGCTNLQSITIHNSAIKIAQGAFRACKKLNRAILHTKSLHYCKDHAIWKAYQLPTTEEEFSAFCEIMDECPKRVRPALEEKIMQSPLRAAAAYFKNQGRLDAYLQLHPSTASMDNGSDEGGDGLDSCGDVSVVVHSLKTDNEDTEAVSRQLAELRESQAKTQTMVQQAIDAISQVQTDTGTIREGMERLVEMLESLQSQITQSKKELQESLQGGTGEADEEQYMCFINRLSEGINAKLSDGNAQTVDAQEAHLKGLFGQYWEKLDAYTRKSLVSARVFLTNCSAMSYSGLDYSGVVIAATSALENELKLRFFDGYKAHLRGKFGDDFDSWPDSMRYKPYGGTYYSENNVFTIGSLPAIFGSRTRGKNGNRFVKDSHSLKDSDKDELKKYLRKLLVDTKSGWDVLTRVQNGLSYLDRCEDVRCEYRNAAAHTEHLSKETAEACCRAIIGANQTDAARKIGRIEGLIYDLVRLFRLPSDGSTG